MAHDASFTPERLSQEELHALTNEAKDIISQVKGLGERAVMLATRLNGHFEANAKDEYSHLADEDAAFQSLEGLYETFDDFDAQGGIPSTFHEFE